MTTRDPIDDRLTALRTLMAAGLAVTSGFAGVAIFSGTRLGGPIFHRPAAAYGLLAAGLLAWAAVLAAGRAVGAAAAARAEPGFPAYAAAAAFRTLLLLIPGFFAVFSFFVTQNWLTLLPLPLVYAAFFAGLPTRRRFDRWPAAPTSDRPAAASANGRYRREDGLDG